MKTSWKYTFSIEEWAGYKQAMKGIVRSYGLRKNSWITCGKDLIRISDFSGKGRFSWFPVEVPEILLLQFISLLFLLLIRKHHKPIFQTLIMYTSQVLYTSPNLCSSAQKRLYRTIIFSDTFLWHKSQVPQECRPCIPDVTWPLQEGDI